VSAPAHALGALRWPIGVGAALALMISASLALAWIAARHPDAPVVEDAWVAERVLLAEAHAERRAELAGWTLAVAAQPTQAGVRIEAEFSDRAGGGAGAAVVSVRRTRPTQAGFDAEFELAREAGSFRGEVPLPRAGRWLLVVRARRGDVLLERRLSHQVQE
jgi:nitrogen fixation protein FixH